MCKTVDVDDSKRWQELGLITCEHFVNWTIATVLSFTFNSIQDIGAVLLYVLVKLNFEISKKSATTGHVLTTTN